MDKNSDTGHFLFELLCRMSKYDGFSWTAAPARQLFLASTLLMGHGTEPLHAGRFSDSAAKGVHDSGLSFGSTLQYNNGPRRSFRKRDTIRIYMRSDTCSAVNSLSRPRYGNLENGRQIQCGGRPRPMERLQVSIRAARWDTTNDICSLFSAILNRSSKQRTTHFCHVLL